MVQRPEPGSGRGRRASISSWVVRAGSTLTPVPVTQRTGTSAHDVPRHVVGGEGQVGRDRRAGRTVSGGSSGGLSSQKTTGVCSPAAVPTYDASTPKPVSASRT